MLGNNFGLKEDMRKYFTEYLSKEKIEYFCVEFSRFKIQSNGISFFYSSFTFEIISLLQFCRMILVTNKILDCDFQF